MTGHPAGRSLATVQQELIRAAARLKASGVPNPSRDARRLMAAALEVEPDRLTLHMADPMSSKQQQRFDGFCAARAGREPISRILAERMFYGRQFKITPYVLDPRPETEMLVEVALADPFDTILDIGTGSGAIVLSILAERPNTYAIATDISADALKTASENAKTIGVADRVRFLRSDWYQTVTGRFDLIVSNPPYITALEIAELEPEVLDHEPRIALTDGADGLAAYREIARGALGHLVSGGRILVEISPTQAQAVTNIFRSAGLTDIRVYPDLDGRDRVVAVRT